MYLFFKGGLQVNRFVSHQKLPGYICLGPSLVVSWCKLYFANHQTTCVPKRREEKTRQDKTRQGKKKKRHAKRVRVCPLYVIIAATA